MPLLSQSEAKHFCKGFKSLPHARQSFRLATDGFGLGTEFKEGTNKFDEFRDGAMGEVERLLFLSISCYRRSFDLFVPSAAAWSHVTLYYSAFYSASAILGMFGMWDLRRRRMIDVIDSAPGVQTFRVVPHRSTYNGSHEAFWELFYVSVNTLVPLLDPAIQFGLQPVGADPIWMIKNRNYVNYDSVGACEMVESFQATFRRTKVRTSLPGVLNTQLRLSEAMLGIAGAFARPLRVRTDALVGVQPGGTRQDKARALIISTAPAGLGSIARKRLMLA